MNKVASPTPDLVLTAQLPSRLSRTEFRRLFPERVGKPARPPFRTSQAIADIWSELLNHPLAKRAAQTLLLDNRVKYSKTVAAISAHLLTGPVGWHRMGLNQGEAKKLLSAYEVGFLRQREKKLVDHMTQVNRLIAAIKSETENRKQEHDKAPRRA